MIENSSPQFVAQSRRIGNYDLLATEQHQNVEKAERWCRGHLPVFGRGSIRVGFFWGAFRQALLIDRNGAAALQDGQ